MIQSGSSAKIESSTLVSAQSHISSQTGTGNWPSGSACVLLNLGSVSRVLFCTRDAVSNLSGLISIAVASDGVVDSVGVVDSDGVVDSVGVVDSDCW